MLKNDAVFSLAAEKHALKILYYTCVILNKYSERQLKFQSVRTNHYDTHEVQNLLTFFMFFFWALFCFLHMKKINNWMWSTR